ncbi:hypothetical protein D3C75_646960 [compost metagenome]
MGDKLLKAANVKALINMAYDVRLSFKEERNGCSQATAGLLPGEAALFNSVDYSFGRRNCSGAYNPEFA